MEFFVLVSRVLWLLDGRDYLQKEELEMEGRADHRDHGETWGYEVWQLLFRFIFVDIRHHLIHIILIADDRDYDAEDESEG